MANTRVEDLRVRKTKKALNDAFVALLCERSFDEITVNELCDAAGIRRATFYKHFADKFAFLTYYVSTLRDRFDNIIWKSAGGDTANYSDYFVAYAMRLIDFISENAVIIENFTSSNLLPSLITIVAEQNFRDTRDRLAAASEAGQLKLIASPETVSAMLVGAVSTTVFAWLKTGRKRSKELVASEIATFIQRVLAD